MYGKNKLEHRGLNVLHLLDEVVRIDWGMQRRPRVMLRVFIMLHGRFRWEKNKLSCEPWASKLVKENLRLVSRGTFNGCAQ